jgi:glycosyltransferase involved in cell wall biosynthesis
MTSQKGPDYFLEAARKVLSKNRTVHFIMAGSGDMMSQVKEEVTRMGMDKNVIFTGFLRGADVERAYAMSDLYVMPSVSEPFGITALEAIMYDVPVIISNQSGVSEVIRNCPRVDFWNTDELADNILTIIEDDMLRDKIVRSCRKELKDVSWKIAAEKIIRVYHEFIMV